MEPRTSQTTYFQFTTFADNILALRPWIEHFYKVKRDFVVLRKTGTQHKVAVFREGIDVTKHSEKPLELLLLNNHELVPERLYPIEPAPKKKPTQKKSKGGSHGAHRIS